MNLNMCPLASHHGVRLNQQESRQISVMGGSPSVQVDVLGVDGVRLVSMDRNTRSAKLTGAIGAIVVSVGGMVRTCDLSGVESSEHIGLHVDVRGGEPLCTLEDVSSTMVAPDLFASTPGRRCKYMSDQRGNSGLVCE